MQPGRLMQRLGATTSSTTTAVSSSLLRQQLSRAAATSGSSAPAASTAAAAAAPVASCSGRDMRTHARRSGSGSSSSQQQRVPVADKLEWAPPLSVIRYPDPRLRAVNARVGVFDDSLRQLARAMFDVMYTDDGVGLAAPQVGVNVRLMVFNETAERGNPAETVLVNPEIIEKSRATELDEEGCLSFPRIYADVERATKIEVRYQDLQGQQQEMQLAGFVARIFQHEYDHLQGVLFHDRMKASELAKVRDQLVALEEAYLAAHPGAAVQRVPPPGQAKAAPTSKGFGSPARR